VQVDEPTEGGPVVDLLADLVAVDVVEAEFDQTLAGLDATGVDGSVLVFNKSRPVVPGLLISRPEYTKPARAALRW
jgi:hypothetical protein